MFRTLVRDKTPPAAGFADTQFLHAADEDDYSGFAPTEMFEDAAAPQRQAVALPDAREAAATSRSVLERAAGPLAPEAAPVEEAAVPASWVTSQWVAAQEARAHEAAHHARVLIAAQRHAGGAPVDAVPRGGLGRLRAALERLLPGDFRSLLPLFFGVGVTMAVISAVLPLVDRP